MACMKAICQNDSFWNVLLCDVTVWINTTSAEDDQRLLLHHCLFSPATHIVFMSGEPASYGEFTPSNNTDISQSLNNSF